MTIYYSYVITLHYVFVESIKLLTLDTVYVKIFVVDLISLFSW